TWGDWFAYQGDEARMREAWVKAYNLYKGMAGHSLDAYLIAEKMRQEKVPLPEEEETAETFTDFPPAPGELRFIDQIHEAWIEGVLEKSKDQNIEIGM
ncbi:MAG: hypothetical protein GWO41_08105, partial [candidate division Zixibacteria bacterium]|nr:hypothetical protein [candidate division Zixibacteria bacterium]